MAIHWVVVVLPLWCDGSRMCPLEVEATRYPPTYPNVSHTFKRTHTTKRNNIHLNTSYLSRIFIFTLVISFRCSLSSILYFAICSADTYTHALSLAFGHASTLYACTLSNSYSFSPLTTRMPLLLLAWLQLLLFIVFYWNFPFCSMHFVASAYFSFGDSLLRAKWIQSRATQKIE